MYMRGIGAHMLCLEVSMMNILKIKATLRRMGALALAMLCGASAIALLIHSQTAGAGVRAGLRLCYEVIIPSLFPFMVLTGFLAVSRASLVVNRLLMPLTAVLRLPRNAASGLLAGLIGGYPVGARTMAVMVQEQHISAQTASRMLCYCVNAGPPFLLCAVGVGMLGSQELGLMLLAAQLGSAMIIGLVMGLFSKGEKKLEHMPQQNSFRPYSVCLVNAINNACTGMFSICAFIIVFSCITTMLSASVTMQMLINALCGFMPAFTPQLMRAAIFGVIEVTTGCKALAGCGFTGVMFIAGLVSLSGLSVVFQVMAALHGSGIKIRGFLLSRFAHCGLTLTVFYFLLRAFPQAVATALSFTAPIKATAGTGGGSLSLLIMCTLFLLSAGKEKTA